MLYFHFIEQWIVILTLILFVTCVCVCIFTYIHAHTKNTSFTFKLQFSSTLNVRLSEWLCYKMTFLLDAHAFWGLLNAWIFHASEFILCGCCCCVVPMHQNLSLHTQSFNRNQLHICNRHTNICMLLGGIPTSGVEHMNERWASAANPVNIPQ